MRLVALILSIAAAGTAFQTPAPAGRREWLDPATGHRVVRLYETGFQYGDLNHLQFNPVDPGLLLYCFTGQFAPGERHVYAVEIARQK